MQASLYDWIVYQRRYKARERKGEREDGWYGGLVQISNMGRQGGSSKRANGDVAEYGRSFSRVLLSYNSRSTEFYCNSLLRKNRSTLSALTLLTSTIKTAWAIRKDFIVLMLSLDISGAYNNVPHERLLYILRAKGFLE